MQFCFVLKLCGIWYRELIWQVIVLATRAVAFVTRFSSHFLSPPSERSEVERDATACDGVCDFNARKGHKCARVLWESVTIDVCYQKIQQNCTNRRSQVASLIPTGVLIQPKRDDRDDRVRARQRIREFSLQRETMNPKASNFICVDLDPLIDRDL